MTIGEKLLPTRRLPNICDLQVETDEDRYIFTARLHEALRPYRDYPEVRRELVGVRYDRDRLFQP